MLGLFFCLTMAATSSFELLIDRLQIAQLHIPEVRTVYNSSE
jgi:hypothetical protein